MRLISVAGFNSQPVETAIGWCRAAREAALHQSQESLESQNAVQRFGRQAHGIKASPAELSLRNVQLSCKAPHGVGLPRHQQAHRAPDQWVEIVGVADLGQDQSLQLRHSERRLHGVRRAGDWTTSQVAPADAGVDELGGRQAQHRRGRTRPNPQSNDGSPRHDRLDVGPSQWADDAWRTPERPDDLDSAGWQVALPVRAGITRDLLHPDGRDERVKRRHCALLHVALPARRHGLNAGEHGHLCSLDARAG